MSELVVPVLGSEASSFMFWLCWSAPLARGGGASGGSASTGPAATSTETRRVRGRTARKIFVMRSSFRTVSPLLTPYARKEERHTAQWRESPGATLPRRLNLDRWPGVLISGGASCERIRESPCWRSVPPPASWSLDAAAVRAAGPAPARRLAARQQPAQPCT